MLDEKFLNEILSISSDDKEKKEGLVKLKMPVFSIECDWSSLLKDTLRDYGVKELFQSPNWQNGIEGTSVDIKQKTKFVLDEEGIEAAAATSMQVAFAVDNKEKPELELTVDRPFLYVLMKEDVPLFIGTVYNPAE